MSELMMNPQIAGIEAVKRFLADDGTWNAITSSLLGGDIAALEGLSGTGIAARTAVDTWALRTLTAPAAGLTISNPGGVAGDPTFGLANDLSAIEALASTGIAVRTGTDAWAQRTLAAPAAGFTITNPSGAGGNPTFVLADDLAALEALSTTGLMARTALNTYAMRTITGPAAGISVSNGDGVAGNPTLALANDLNGLENLATTGLAARTAANAWTTRTLTAPAAGITVSNGDGVSGNPTLALANDLGAIEALASTGIAARTTTDTWAQRTLAAPAAGLTITNPAGVAGDPTFALANDLSALEGLTGTGFAKRTGTDAWSLVTPAFTDLSGAASAAQLGWTKVTVNYNSSGLVVASTTGSYLIFTSAGNQFIEVCGVNVVAPFTYGKGSAVAFTIGKAGDQARWHDSVDATGSGIGGVGGTRPKYGVMDGSGNGIRAYFTAGANLNTMTDGSVDIWYRALTMP